MLVLAIGLCARAQDAHAGPRDDMRVALEQARLQLDELDLEGALATLDAAIAKAKGTGNAVDPALAPLLVLRGGILYSIDGDRSRTVAAFQEAIRADYSSALPIELRSPELQALLDEARAGVPRPRVGPIVHTVPEAAAGQDIVLDALSSVPLEDGATMTLHWRPKGSEDPFLIVSMDVLGNLGTTTLTAAEHGDGGIEYFFSAKDGEGRTLASYGGETDPLRLEMGTGKSREGRGRDRGKERRRGREGRGKEPGEGPRWPRAFINLGVGTGVGLARGSAELTYQQYDPGTTTSIYGPAQQACAIERWFAGGEPVAGNPAEFTDHLAMLDPSYLPGGDGDALIAAYDPERCAERHPVVSALASAPLHFAPEVGVRVLDRSLGGPRSLALVVAGFARLQVVTGSRVFTVDPSQSVQTSYIQEVRSPEPQGFRIRPPFTWAAGLKLKALIGKPEGKVRGMVGIFGGYGNARLRVRMPFSDDRNGNSVPDEREVAITGPVDDNNMIPPDQCIPVWPFNDACMSNAAGAEDERLADDVRGISATEDDRIDTVRLGPGFAGALFGIHIQLHDNFALYGETNVGGWFTDTSSLLIDITVGPVITF